MDAREESGEVLAVDPVHGNQSLAVNLSEVVDPHYMVAADPGRQDDLPLQAQQAAQVGREFRPDDLDGDGAVQLPIERAVYPSHTSRTNLFNELVALLAAGLAGSGGRGRAFPRRWGGILWQH